MDRRRAEQQTSLIHQQNLVGGGGFSGAPIANEALMYQQSGKVYKFYLNAKDHGLLVGANKAVGKLPIQLNDGEQLPQASTIYLESICIETATAQPAGDMFYDVKSQLLNNAQYAGANEKTSIWERWDKTIWNAYQSKSRTRNTIGREIKVEKLMNNHLLDYSIVEQTNTIIDLTDPADNVHFEIVVIVPSACNCS